MSELHFEFEWSDPLGARGAELRATWARLAINVGGRYASRVLDQRSRTVRDAVYVPLYPIAEWFVANWWLLLFEIESSERTSDPLYRQRHSLQSAREGYSLPDMTFSSFGEMLQLAWRPDVLTHHAVEFLESGSAYVAVESVRRALTSFVNAVITRLRAEGVSNTFLQNEWQALNDLGEDEASFCIAAAGLGLDPFAVDEQLAADIVEVATQIPENLRREFFAAASRDHLHRDASNISSAINQAECNTADLSPLRHLRDHLLPAPARDGLPPWQEGYAVARRVRELTGVGNDPLCSFDDLARAFRIDIEQLDAAIVDQPIASGVYEAAVATNRLASPAFAMSRRSDPATRFRFCRGLSEYLTVEEQGPWLVTKALSDRQKRSRAFAAEFLAPAAAIRQKVAGSVVSSEEVDDLATYFGVASAAIIHQLSNHKIASVAW